MGVIIPTKCRDQLTRKSQDSEAWSKGGRKFVDTSGSSTDVRPLLLLRALSSRCRSRVAVGSHNLHIHPGKQHPGSVTPNRGDVRVSPHNRTSPPPSRIMRVQRERKKNVAVFLTSGGQYRDTRWLAKGTLHTTLLNTMGSRHPHWNRDLGDVGICGLSCYPTLHPIKDISQTCGIAGSTRVDGQEVTNTHSRRAT